MNILDIQAIKNVDSPRKDSNGESAGVIPVAKVSKKKKNAASPKKGLVDGMSANAYGTYMKQIFDMTKEELGVG